MKKMQFSQTAEVTKKKRRIFYTALGLCLVAIGIALYIGINQTVQEIHEDRTIDLNNTSSKIDVVQNEDDDPQIEDVNKNESDVAVESETSGGNTSSEASKTPVQPKKLSFAMPLEGETSNDYSNGELVKSKTLNEWRTHDGIDLKAAANTPVKAVADGTVESITEDAMWGVTVTVSHQNGYESIYCGLKPSVPVKKGAEVKVGDILGYVGNTAEIEIAEESHLHLGIKKDGSWVDPMSLMK
ncbi:M23 family metallopeptidase [Massiliimalia massiliensis]|jgi:murein DD-endopeptidase MepM/ murein hydrolase activator NlpD|uniref:M23 family metallopeptidase n=1 Tax=Massiliimalia massiliensis TaxID=1852384 RepID=UPI00135645FE|nr:M23 family metallopeptidase [Massiliimalia massiliensis]